MIKNFLIFVTSPTTRGHVWSKRLLSAAGWYNSVAGTAADDQGNVIATGCFTSVTMDFGGASVTTTGIPPAPNSSYDGYLSRIT